MRLFAARGKSAQTSFAFARSPINAKRRTQIVTKAATSAASSNQLQKSSTLRSNAVSDKVMTYDGYYKRIFLPILATIPFVSSSAHAKHSPPADGRQIEGYLPDVSAIFIIIAVVVCFITIVAMRTLKTLCEWPVCHRTHSDTRYPYINDGIIIPVTCFKEYDDEKTPCK